MSQVDLEINRDVRKVLVRHWIDLGKLSFRSTNGKLWVRGSLQRIAGVQEELTTALVDSIFTDIKRIRGVVSLSVELENWIQSLGKWLPLDRTKAKTSQRILSSSESGVQEISDKT
jgi:hypothetical protein